MVPALGTSNVSPSLEVASLTFTYPGLDGRPPPGAPPLFSDLTFRLYPGDRCLLVGANGAGKTTLLRVLAGKHMVETGMVRVLGQSPFHDTSLEASGDVTYLGGEWRRDVAFAGFGVPYQAGISAGAMLAGVLGVDPERKDRLVKVLDINLDWRLDCVSDGERRRVQIAMGLLRPFKVLLLDEITVDLDVLARADLMRFLVGECEQSGATILYATHIFDGLERWPTRLAYLAFGQLKFCSPIKEVLDSSQKPGYLMRAIEQWLRADLATERQRRQERKAKLAEAGPEAVNRAINNGWAAGRMNPTVMIRGSTNSVLRT